MKIKKVEKNKGITLITLIITVILLAIIAAVGVSLGVNITGSARFENVLVAGTRGWQVPESENDPSFTEEDKKIYAREKIRLELALEDMQKKRKAEDKVVCLIHYPPFNSKKEDSYFTELFEKYHVDAVIYGHLHKSAGRYPNIYIKNNIKYYLTSADLISMKPVLIEI